MRLFEIRKAYGENIVFEKLSCDIEKNTVTCVVGPSGCGKTTMLRIMMGLVLPDSGHCEGFTGLKMSAVFQEDRLCENLSAMSNIRLVCSQTLQRDAVYKALAAVNLDPANAGQTVRDMSGGQRRRVAILRALLAEHEICFMDEPFRGLDADTKTKVLQYTKEKIRGKTAIIVTHDESECEALGGSLIALRGAAAAASG